MALSPDCEAPLKKEGGLPEGPVLEALLCAETGEKKIELKEEETIMDCQVGPPLRGPGRLVTPATCPGAPCSRSLISPGSLGPSGLLSRILPHLISVRKTSLLALRPQSPAVSATPTEKDSIPHFLDLSLPSGVQKQQLLEFPHDLEVEDLEDDIPRRKNRAKGKVSPPNLSPSPLSSVTDPIH